MSETPASTEKKWTIEGAALGWFGAMTSESSASNRAAMARLRRVRNPIDALHVPEALKFVRECMSNMPSIGNDRLLQDRILMIPIILSHVDEHLPERGEFGRYLAKGRNLDTPLGPDEKPSLDQVHFRRLLATDQDGLIENMRQTITRLGGMAPVPQLARTILHWKSDNTIRRLTTGYYGAFPFKKKDNK